MSPKPYNIFASFVMTGLIIAPVSYWMSNQLNVSNHTHMNVFYENSCTADEIERYRMQDEIERQAKQMIATNGYGYVQLLDNRGI